MANKRIKDLGTTITAFRTGDVIPVDGPSGTAKMGKDDLLRVTAENALAGNVAPAFDATANYSVGDVVEYGGKVYKFTANHSAGAWNYSEVATETIGNDVSLLFNGGVNDASILSTKLSRLDSITRNLNLSDFILYSNKFVSGEGAGRVMVLASNSDYDVYRVKLSDVKSFIKFPYDSTVAGQELILADSEDKIVVRLSAGQVPTTSENWVSVQDGVVTIDKVRALGRSTYAYEIVVVMKKTNRYLIADFSLSVRMSDLLWLKYEDDVKNVVDSFGVGRSELVLQPRVDWIGGVQFNCYYENILLNAMERQCFVLTKQHDENELFYSGLWRWNVQPVVSASRSYETIMLFDYSLNKSRDFTFDIYVLPKTTATGSYKVMLIGDSKVAMGTLPQLLNDKFTDDENTNISFVGTLTSGGVANEGRSGWTAYNYCNSSSYNGFTNPFLNDGVFDFSHYMTTQGFSGVDCVCILLGTNDATSNKTHTEILSYYEEMIASIKSYNPSVKIVLGLAENTCQLQWKYSINKNRILSFVKSLITKYGNSRSSNIFLAPLYMNINLYMDYNFTEVAEASGSSVMVERPVDYVHQSVNGYRKNADVLYCAIKGALA